LTLPELSTSAAVAAGLIAAAGLVLLARRRAQGQLAVSGKNRSITMLMVGVTLVALALAATGVYQRIKPGGGLDARGGRPDAAASVADGASAGSGRSLSQDQLQRMVDQVSETLKTKPDDTASWVMLAHSYEMMGRFPEALAAYAKLSALLPKDANVLADYADAMGVANGRSLQGEPAKLIAQALALDAKNLKALTLAGKEAFERKSYAESVDYWERARSTANDPTFIAQIEVNIAESRALGGLAAPKTKMSASANSSAASAAASFITGRVTVATALKGQFGPDDALFVFARPAEGSRMPVALMRRKASDLPFDFALDDSMAMVPEFKLSKQAKVIVGARISKQGDARPQPGDLQVLSAPVTVGTRGIKLEITEVVK
jgi:cytochrome c-type biogenesis protein CcmH